MSEVSVNGVAIPDEAIREEAAGVEERGVDARRAAAAHRLVVRELLRQRAGAVGLDTLSDEEGAVEALMEREVPAPAVEEAACRRYFEANAERFHTSVTVEARHILLAAAPEDPDGRGEAEQHAEGLIGSLMEDAESFADLAARHSHCPSAADGGHLGAVARGQTVPELEEVMLRLEPGLARRPVETRYGFHVVEILARHGGEPLPYEAVSHLIGDYIRERSWRRAVSQYIGQLAAEAEIRGVDLDPPESLLVQ